jgi:dihydroxy-acid dehydratase
MYRHNAALLNANGGLDLIGNKDGVMLDHAAIDGLDYDAAFDRLVKTGTLKLGIVIASQGPEAFGMPEMFTPMQHINANRTLRRLATLISDGRYSGVSYGAAVGHITPEATRGGDIIRLMTGDLLHLRFRARRVDLLDPIAFREGTLAFAGLALLGGRDELARERMARLKARQRQVAASNRMTYCTDASRGVVPQAVWDECDQSFWDVASVSGVA